MVVRLPFLGTIGPDEGGYAYIASRWADGHQLYRDAWIDRPQGLILAYRLLLWFGHHAWTLRVGAVVAGALITLLLVAAGRAVTPAAGLIAGALFATVGVAPHIEGFTFNGELAACVPATAAVAAAFAAYRRTSRLGLAVAALLGSTAILMKQSGFDGLVVVFAVAWVGARTRSDRRARMGFAAAGATPPLAASAVAGWSTGWSSYWSAVVGSHLGPGLDSRASHLVASLPAASRDLLPLVAVAALGAWQARTGWGPARFAAIWLVAALAGVNAGGLYWPHYYVQLLPPLCLLAGIGLASLGRPLVASTAAAVVALPAVVFVVGLATAPDRLQDRMVKYALAYENDRTIARYVRAHTSPTDTVYAFASRADFYFLAQRPAALPYLWGHPLRSVPGAFESLEDMLASSRRPRLVVLFQRRPLRRHASVRLLLARYYRQVWRAPRTGTPVLAATESQPAELTR